MRWTEPDPAPRSPLGVDDDPGDPAPPGLPVADGLDTNGDGTPDTVVTAEGSDLLLHTDLDGDGLADQILRIGPGRGSDAFDPDPGASGWWLPQCGAGP
ncbi:hypothetical protein ACFQE5_17790 [Pseudonocardia hispaniensis]|uniref:FG-GAP repeat protein n=1 Tax=Pseudonocardia hispaniensis TaxID=904933 RepID=A0ABW1J5K8_9PSEU